MHTHCNYKKGAAERNPVRRRQDPPPGASASERLVAHDRPRSTHTRVVRAAASREGKVRSSNERREHGTKDAKSPQALQIGHVRLACSPALFLVDDSAHRGVRRSSEAIRGHQRSSEENGRAPLHVASNVSVLEAVAKHRTLGKVALLVRFGQLARRVTTRGRAHLLKGSATDNGWR